MEMYQPTRDEWEAINNIREAKQIYGDPDHICQKDACNLYDIMNNIWICTSTGNIHHCTLDTCDQKQIRRDQVFCSMTGVEHKALHQYEDSDLQRVLGLRKSGAMMGSHPRKDNSSMVVSNWSEDGKKMQFAMQTINFIMFSDIRKNFYRDKIDVAKKDMIRFYKEYRARVYTPHVRYQGNACDIYIHRVNLISKHRIKSILQPSKDIVNLYAMRILHMWKILLYAQQKNKNIKDSTISFNVFCLAIFYMFRNGINYGKKFIYPPDDFVSEFAPSVQDLKVYNLQNQSITRGQNVMNNILQALHHHNDSIETIQKLKYLTIASILDK
jgi:hypothetical protein